MPVNCWHRSHPNPGSLKQQAPFPSPALPAGSAAADKELTIDPSTLDQDMAAYVITLVVDWAAGVLTRTATDTIIFVPSSDGTPLGERRSRNRPSVPACPRAHVTAHHACRWLYLFAHFTAAGQTLIKYCGQVWLCPALHN